MNIEFLRTAYEMQQELNVKYSGENWKMIPEEHFVSALLDEYAELLQSIPRIGVDDGGWKWWRKNLENDQQNALVELVDIFHFGLSLTMYDNTIDENIEIVGKSNYVAHLGFGNMQRFFLSFLQTYDILELIDCIELGLKLIGKTEEDFISFYMQKNELNHKRVEGGYIDGQYDKNSSGQEDNRSIK